MVLKKTSIFFTVQLEVSMKDKSPCSVDSNLVDAGYFLKEILDNKSRKECLQTFVKCQKIIMWLREWTKSTT